MKILFATILSTLFFSTAFSTATLASEPQRIAKAADILAVLAQGSNQYQVKPGDVKSMLLEFALNEQMVDSKEEFDDNWQGNSGDAWEADSMNWGTDTASGALSYITETLKQDFEASERTDADKIKYADCMASAKRAFQILKSVKSVKFGVAPTGAVQCGVSLASLFILDTATGTIYQIIMEGSGC